MALQVQKYPVFGAILASMNTPDDMVIMPSRQFRDLLVADRTQSILL